MKSSLLESMPFKTRLSPTMARSQFLSHIHSIRLRRPLGYISLSALGFAIILSAALQYVPQALTGFSPSLTPHTRAVHHSYSQDRTTHFIAFPPNVSRSQVIRVFNFTRPCLDLLILPILACSCTRCKLPPRSMSKVSRLP